MIGPSNGAARTTMVATGTVGGFFSGLVGGGGGAVMIPLMTGVLKMRQHTAHGTSLVIIFVTAIATAATYAIQGDVDAPLVAMLLAGSAAGAVLGARGARRIPALRLRQLLGAGAAAQVSDRGLRVIVSSVLIGIGVQMVATATRGLRRERALEMESAAGAAAS